MLNFNRKQMAQIGSVHMHEELAQFLREHAPQAASMDATTLDREIDGVLDHCRSLGLKHQGTVAAFALACATLGSASVECDPALHSALDDRHTSEAEKALIIRIWLTHAGVSLTHATR